MLTLNVGWEHGNEERMNNIRVRRYEAVVSGTDDSDSTMDITYKDMEVVTNTSEEELYWCFPVSSILIIEWMFDAVLERYFNNWLK